MEHLVCEIALDKILEEQFNIEIEQKFFLHLNPNTAHKLGCNSHFYNFNRLDIPLCVPSNIFSWLSLSLIQRSNPILCSWHMQNYIVPPLNQHTKPTWDSDMKTGLLLFHEQQWLPQAKMRSMGNNKFHKQLRAQGLEFPQWNKLIPTTSLLSSYLRSSSSLFPPPQFLPPRWSWHQM